MDQAAEQGDGGCGTQARQQIAVKARSWRRHSIIPVTGFETNKNRASKSDKATGVFGFSQDLGFHGCVVGSVVFAAPSHQRIFVTRRD